MTGEGEPRLAAPRRAAGAVVAIGALAAAALATAPAGLGVTVVAAALLAIGAAAAPRRDAWSVVWWLAAAALAAVPAVRSAGWVVWPSLVGAGALATLAATSGAASWRQAGLGLARAASLPAGLLVVVRPVAAVRPGAGWRPALQGIAIGAVLLAVFVPLLAGADAAFAHLLAEAVPDDTVDRPFARAGILLLVLAAGGALLHAGLAPPPEPGAPGRPRLARAAWAVPLGALVTLFAAFAALQVSTLYAGHDHVLRTAGLTYAEYAREGFAQLIAAAALTLAVIAGAARWARRERLLMLLLGALCALCLVILASALTRLSLYEDAYGLTRLRLAAHVHIFWLGGLFALILVAGRTRVLPRAAVALSAAAMLAFAAVDPDRRIAEHNVDRYERTGRIDERHLGTLSADAAPALVRLPQGLAACTTATTRRELSEPDGLAGLNLARARAREVLRERDGASCRDTARLTP